MELAYTLFGSAPLMKKFQVNATVARAGVPHLIPGAGNAGLVLGTTTGATDLVGVNLDTATYVTAQQTDGSSAARMITVVINPDAVWRMLMSGGATENTALALQTVTTASTTGLDVTTAASWTSTEFDEGYVWGYDGANAGQARKITSTSATAGTVTVAFDQDTVVGDNFLRCPYSPMQGATIQLSTLLTQADASIAVGTGAPFRPIELLLRDINLEGRTNSFVLAVSNSHALRLA